MRVSLIVLNYQGREVLTACLDSLLADLGPEDEIIVVDNASSDGSSELVPDHPQVRLLQRMENNFIFGLNDGVAAARGQYVAFLNNDIVVEAGFITSCLAEFDSPQVFAVCPRILSRDGGEQGALTAGLWRNGLIFYQPLPHDPHAQTTFFAVGGQSFFDASKLRVLHSIDEFLWPMYHEDIELSYRAWKAGWTVRYAPSGVVHHVGGHSSNKKFSKHQVRSFVRQNEYLTVWKNITDPWLMAQHLCLLPLRLATAFAHGDWATLVGFSNAVKRLPRLAERRRSARDLAVLSDREVLARVKRPLVDGADRQVPSL